MHLKIKIFVSSKISIDASVQCCAKLFSHMRKNRRHFIILLKCNRSADSVSSFGGGLKCFRFYTKNLKNIGIHFHQYIYIVTGENIYFIWQVLIKLYEFKNSYETEVDSCERSICCSNSNIAE